MVPAPNWPSLFLPQVYKAPLTCNVAAVNCLPAATLPQDKEPIFVGEDLLPTEESPICPATLFPHANNPKACIPAVWSSPALTVVHESEPTCIGEDLLIVVPSPSWPVAL